MSFITLLFWLKKKKKNGCQSSPIQETYSESTPSVKICEFRRFKSDDLDLKNKKLFSF